MNDFERLGMGLGGLPLVTKARTRSISAENPSGAKGKGGMAIPNVESLSLAYPGSPIAFQSDLRVTIQALGWWPNRTFQPLADDITRGNQFAELRCGRLELVQE